MQSPTKTKGARRGKSDPRMALVKWARENGAVHIKVDGIELTFPPNYGQDVAAPSLSPADIIARGSKSEPFNLNAPDAVVAERPEAYADNSDRWASFLPIA